MAGIFKRSRTICTNDDYIRYRERDHAHGKTSAGMLRQIIRVSKFWREYTGQICSRLRRFRGKADINQLTPPLNPPKHDPEQSFKEPHSRTAKC
jgi:hypothetical protein